MGICASLLYEHYEWFTRNGPSRPLSNIPSASHVGGSTEEYGWSADSLYDLPSGPLPWQSNVK